MHGNTYILFYQLYLQVNLCDCKQCDLPFVFEVVLIPNTTLEQSQEQSKLASSYDGEIGTNCDNVESWNDTLVEITVMIVNHTIPKDMTPWILSCFPFLKWSHSNSFEHRAPADFIYGCPMFKLVAETWLHGRVSAMATTRHAPL